MGGQTHRLAIQKRVREQQARTNGKIDWGGLEEASRVRGVSTRRGGRPTHSQDGGIPGTSSQTTNTAV